MVRYIETRSDAVLTCDFWSALSSFADCFVRRALAIAFTLLWLAEAIALVVDKKAIAFLLLWLVEAIALVVDRFRDR